ncbi:MAG TPA: tryptophan 7-halogenase [Pseudonocardiaceae bacterium]|nr:tryptophan 7-halogenase [Pseudonocardiaceae bacterium]
MDESKNFDVAVIGGGIGGTLLATILARNGVRVVCLEGGSHPRFAIGEATVPDSTLGMRVLAARYGVPELLNLSNYRSMRRHVAATSGVKRSFSFVYHREGQSNHPQECTQYPTFAPPIGPDMHYFRQDVDAYLFSLAVSYGAVCHTETRVTDVQFDDDGVRLTAAGKGQESRSFHAQYVVDAGGLGALLPQILGLREEPCPYKTRSRAIFTHMVGVPPYEQMGPECRAHGMATPVSQGTLHHIFHGGWMWIIPFGNHPMSTNRLCSVGLVLDLDEFPEQEIAPEEEFWSIVKRFPGIFRHLRDAAPVRSWVRTSRLQFSSRHVVGDRFCLLPHASDFVDPLFSSGLTNTVMAVNALAHRLIKAARQKDFATENFQYVDTWVKRVFAYYDQLVMCSYIAFRDFELWNAWHRVWMVGTLYSGNPVLQALVQFEQHRDPAVFEQLERPPYRGLQSIDYPEFWKLFTSAVSEMRAVRDQSLSPAEASRNIYRLLAESRLCPDPWQLCNPENRCPAGAATLLPILRLLVWGKYRSPEFVRQHYFDAGLSALRVFGSDLRRSGTAEIRRALTGPWGYFRDGLVSQNRDWADKGNGARTRVPRSLPRASRTAP